MSAFTPEQRAQILARRARRRAAWCPLCGGAIVFEDASTPAENAVRFECEGCGALASGPVRDDADPR